MSNLREAASALIKEVDTWYYTTLSDGSIAVYVDEQAKILFNDVEQFSRIYESALNMKSAMEERPDPPTRAGSQIDNGFSSMFKEIMDHPGEWVSREGLTLPVARSLKRQLKMSSEWIGVSTRTMPDGITLYARLVPNPEQSPEA